MEVQNEKEHTVESSTALIENFTLGCALLNFFYWDSMEHNRHYKIHTAINKMK